MHVACRCHDDKLLQEIAIIFFYPDKDMEIINVTACWSAGTLREDTVLIFERVHITHVLKG